MELITTLSFGTYSLIGTSLNKNLQENFLVKLKPY